jgi:o-succinylbenzoate synthase
MRIDSIQLFRVPQASLESDPGARVEAVLAAIVSGGQVGWGEVSVTAAPRDGAEWAAGVFACLRDWLAPTLIGRSISSGVALQDLLRPFRGNSHAKAALDMAWWNLAAIQQGKPLYQCLGGQARAIPLSTTQGVMSSIDELLDAIRLSFELGYHSVALKFRPGWDLQMVRAVRQVFAVEPIAVDCDGLCTLGQQETFYRLEDFHLEFIEQPLEAGDLVGHAMLQQALRTPLRLDQSATSLERVEQAIDLGSCRQIRIDPRTTGGFTPALAIREVCAAAQLPCALGAGGSSALGTYATLALATLPGFSLPAETVRDFELPNWEKVERMPEFQKNQGKLFFLPADRPGAGISIDLEALAGAATEHAMLR